MTIQAFVDVLNELRELEIDRNGGEYAYILVKNTSDVREKLTTVGVTEQEIKNVGDDDSFCLLALALSKHPGQLEYDGTFRLSSKITIKQLYKKQTELDERIIKDKGLEGQDLLPSSVLALQVELAELANEWRGFKHWSNDQEPRTQVRCARCEGCGWYYYYKFEDSLREIKTNCGYCNGKGYTRQPLLEEYVDCLHFFLSIARQIGLSADEVKPIYQKGIRSDVSTVELISVLFSGIVGMRRKSKIVFIDVYSDFRELGDRLGLTWEQVAKAYMEKNKINYERLANGY